MGPYDLVVGERTISEDQSGIVCDGGTGSANIAYHQITSEGRVRDRQRAEVLDGACSREVGNVVGKGAVCDRQRAPVLDRTAAVCGVVGEGRGGDGDCAAIVGDTPGAIPTVVRDGTLGYRQGPAVEDATVTHRKSSVVRDGTLGYRQGPAVEDATGLPGAVSRDRTLGQSEGAAVEDAATADDARCPRWKRSAGQGQPLEGHDARRRYPQETESRGTGVPLNAGGRRPCPRDGQRAGNHWQAIRPIRVVVNRREDIGARLQANRVPLSIGIGCPDRGNQARDVPGATMEGLRLGGVRGCQGEPKGCQDSQTGQHGAVPPRGSAGLARSCAVRAMCVHKG